MGEALAEAGRAQGLLERGEEPPFTGGHDIHPHLSRAAPEGAVLDGGTLWGIQEMVTAARRLVPYRARYAFSVEGFRLAELREGGSGATVAALRDR